MMQDPKKKEVGEMGKPSLKAKFEAAMQKKFDSDNKKKAPEERISRMVKDVREYKDPDWYKKEAIMQKEKKSGIIDAIKPSIVKDLERYMKPLKSMSKPKKGKY